MLSVSRHSVWEKKEKIGRIVGAEREVPSYPLDRRPVHPIDPNDFHPYPSLNIIILPKLQSHPNSAGSLARRAPGKFFNFLIRHQNFPRNWHKLACVTESLNPCSLHRHFISQARQTQHFARSARRGACRASLKIPRLSRLDHQCCYSY